MTETGQIICGDSRELLAGVVADAANPIIVTDPPFNVGYHYDCYADKMAEDEYYDMLSDIFAPCPFVVIHYPEAIYRIAVRTNRCPDRVVSWVYNSNTPRQHRDVGYFGVSPCFDGMGEYKNPTDRRIAQRIAAGKKAKGYDWLYCDQVKNVSKKSTDARPCMMPLKVMLYVVGSLPEDATIIDPFAGSGTTLLAAKRLGRKYCGIEISSAYCRKIESRLANDSPLFDFETGNQEY